MSTFPGHANRALPEMSSSFKRRDFRPFRSPHCRICSIKSVLDRIGDDVVHATRPRNSDVAGCSSSDGLSVHFHLFAPTVHDLASPRGRLWLRSAPVVAHRAGPFLIRKMKSCATACTRVTKNGVTLAIRTFFSFSSFSIKNWHCHSAAAFRTLGDVTFFVKSLFTARRTNCSSHSKPLM